MGLGRVPSGLQPSTTAPIAGQFRRALQAFNYEKCRDWCAEQRRAGRSVGIGMACFAEKRQWARGNMPGSKSARVRARLKQQLILVNALCLNGL